MPSQELSELNVDLGISTMRTRLDLFVERSLVSLARATEECKNTHFRFLVVVQDVESEQSAIRVEELISDALLEQDVQIILDQRKGLSRSRNQILEKFEGDFLMICDDDIEYSKNSLREIMKVVESSDMDFYSFMLFTPDGENYKEYKASTFVHNMKTIASVSSVEIMLRSTVKKSGVIFDSSFGRGARWPCGEENIFLADLIRKGLKGAFVPVKIGSHPKPLDADSMSNQELTCKGASLTRTYGRRISLAAVLYLWLRKSKPLRFRDLGALLSGRREYLKSLKEETV